MPASRRRGGGRDARWQTLVWLAAAAAAWWAVQPGGVIPSSMTGLAVLVWVALLARAAVGARGGWTLLLATWVFFAVPWLVVLAWVGDVSVAGWPPLALYSAAYPAVLAVLLRWLDRWRWVVPLSVSVGVLGLSLEYIRAEVLFDAWPFHLAGHSLWGSEQVILARLGGVWACSLLVYAAGGLLAAVLTSPRMVWELVLPGALLVTAWATPRPVPLDAAAATVLAVQTNLAQDNKIGWPLDRQQGDVESFLALTAKGLLPQAEPDLIVWPETMVPGLGFDPATMHLFDTLGTSADALARWPRLIMHHAMASGTFWLVGSPTWSGVQIDEGAVVSTSRFNSAVLIGSDGSVQRYDKIFLTPFGETMPYVRAWPWLESLVMDFGAAGMRFDLDAGGVSVPLELPLRGGELWRLATPICFEDAVPSVTRSLCVHDGRVDVDAIVNISNDGWFGSSDAGRRVHAVAAAFRAVEMGRPLLRVANTGITGLYLPDGTTATTLEPRVAETMLAALPRYAGQPVQAQWGNWLPRLCLLLAIAGIVVRLAAGPSRVAR